MRFPKKTILMVVIHM
jgi:hypothetical protein